MRKILTLIAALSLVASLAVGGTIAYLQDTDMQVNVMTLGNVEIEIREYERVVGTDGKWVTTGETDKYGFEPDKIQEFTQLKPLLPAVYANDAGTMIWDQRNEGNYKQSWGEAGASGANQLFDPSVKNVQDKFVFAENTGKTDAYVRTFFAFEQGTMEGAQAWELLHLNQNATHWNWSGALDDIEGVTAEDNIQLLYDVDIDGNKYFVLAATYVGSTVTSTGILEAGAVSYPSLLQVYMDPIATNEDLIALDGNENELYDILVLTQAVQADGFANAKTALDTAFNPEDGLTAAQIADWFEKNNNSNIITVSTNDEFVTALQGEDKDADPIVISLANDVTIDVDAWQNDALGGKNTESITIDGNGKTIIFNQTNSDWNNITTEGAKLIIKNAHLTNAGHNDGPWNRHDLNFACDVVLENVTTDKAIALKAGGTLKNVTINDKNTSDTYALWIQPKGQTVTLDGCTIDMIDCSDGRGIKIDNQYLGDEEGKVTLNVSNTTFKTEEKSAILVKSTKGAVINLKNVDISGVKADSTNAVWVDGETAEYADLVTVTGGKKVVEQ